MFWYLYADVRGRIRDVFWYLYTDVRGRIMITCSRICMLRWRVDNDDVCICTLTSNAGYNAMLPARWLQMQPYMLWYLYADFRGRYRWHQSAADYRQRINFQENRICLQHWRHCPQIRHQVTCFDFNSIIKQLLGCLSVCLSVALGHFYRLKVLVVLSSSNDFKFVRVPTG